MTDDHALFRPGAPDLETISGDALVVTRGLSHEYRLGSHRVPALKDVTLAIAAGSLVAIHGRSGSGKTTLLNMLGGLDKPTAGSVLFAGENITAMDEAGLVEVRRDRVGFIFQAFGLIPILTAAENVEIPLRLTRAPVAERTERARTLLDLVGLAERVGHRPHELSGGEKQRVAIARALANRPQLLLADEPTGQLDSATGRRIMALLHEVVVSENVTAIVATHDPALIDLADRVLELRDGYIAADSGG